MTQTDDVMFGHILPPVGAVGHYHWECDDGVWSRCFEGTRRTVGGTEVAILGVQHPDGRVDRHILIYEADDQTAASARAIAAALVEAADELEGLK